MTRRANLNVVVAATVLFAMACSEDFEAFTDVTKLRVLAIQSEPAELMPGEIGQLSALVAADDNASVTYQWSWCPVATSAIMGHECPVTEEMLLAAIAQNGGGAFEIPEGVSLFDLGTSQTAVFPFIIGADVLQIACTQLVAQAGDQLPFLPDCEGSLDTTVKLVVNDGVDEVVVVKQLNLLLSESLIANRNPALGTLTASDSEGVSITLEEAPGTLVSQHGYELAVSLSPQVSESFETTDVETGAIVIDRESLFMTWFISGGETEYGRTSYIPGETEFDKLRLNTWWPPRVAESDGTATLYLVLQDERGGTSWLTRTVQLQER
ncbi:MAG: hypothetical protein JXX29_01740 [Deltaproteobacteria bacterium]|nr:hypothetical protein [Deltaproteobacteria bacterium]MBN2670362.1 hypothetical protein [Deltaproteobacteria bacterium]